MRDRKGLNPDGRGSEEKEGEVEGGKTMISIYHEQKICFSIEGKIKFMCDFNTLKNRNYVIVY